MKPPRLTPRLQEAAHLVGSADCLADVGCDHGKLCLYCLMTGIADRAVAIDISRPSLDKAACFADEYGVRLTCLHGDGLTPLAADEADCVVIAGMGGMEIGRILASAAYCPRRLVLVPHHNADMVLRYISLAGYLVNYDAFLADGKHWYRAVRAARTATAHPLGADWQRQIEALDPNENWYVGADNAHNPQFPAYRAQRMAHLAAIIAEGNRRPEAQAEWHYLDITKV